MINKIMSYFGYEKKAATYRDTSGWFSDWIRGGGPTVSGINIGNDSALTIATVFACINNISTDVAKVPIKVFQKKNGKRVELDDHPLRYILDKQSNPYMTAMSYRQASTAHILGWGNLYSEIVRDSDGSIAELYPLSPSQTTLKRDKKSGRFYFETYSTEGQKFEIWAENILHVPGLGFDGYQGYNVIHYARESLGLAKATETFGSSYFGNGTSPGGYLEHPGQLSEAAQKNLLDSISKTHSGPEKAHKILLLEEGMKFNQSTIPPEESQFLETRQFSIPEICRWFRMPPHKVSDLSRATFSNIEEQSLEYVTDTLVPWFRRWEQAIWMKLLSEQEKRDGIYVEHVAEGLLRGNIQARYTAYQIAIGNNNNPGFMTINEIRERENLNPMFDGDELFTPQANDSSVGDEAIVTDMAARIYKREQNELKASMEKHGEAFDLESFYEKFTQKQCEYIEKVTAPLNAEITAVELIGKTQDEIKEILCTTLYSKA